MSINPYLWIYIIHKSYNNTKYNITHIISYIGYKMGTVDSLCDTNPKSQLLSLQQQQPQTHPWCTFECIDNYTVIVQLSYAVTLLIMAVFVLTNLYKLMVKLRDQDIRDMFGSQYVTVYKIVLCWLICSIVKVSINLSIYWKYMSDNFKQQYQRQLSSDYTINELAVLSAMFNVFDFLCIFCVLLLILLIPHKWISNTLRMIHEPQLALSSANSSQTSVLSLRLSLKYYFRVLAIVRIYYKYVRILFLPLLFIQPLILFFVQSPVSCQLPTINYMMAIGQSVLILVFYAFCFRVVKFLRKNQLIRISKKDYKMLSIQYILLLSALILRILLNFYFRVSPFYEYKPTSTCSDPIKQNKIKATIFLVLAHYLMHALAIIIIVRIYRPDMDVTSASMRGEVSLIYSGDSQSTMKTEGHTKSSWDQ